MKLLVGIPTHRRPDLLRKCLESIAAQEGDLPSTAVFVADNDPTRREGCELVEELAHNFRFPISATVVEEPGISAVRNAILDEARRSGADFIAMIDDDETASAQWLSELLKVQSEYGADVVGGPVIRNVPISAPGWIRHGIFRSQRHVTGPIELIDATGNVLLSVKGLQRLSWPEFDRGYGLSGGGDREFFLRIKRAGARFAWAADAGADETVPAGRVTAAWFVKRNFRYGNIGYQLNRTYGPGLNPSPLWALTSLLALPVLGVIALHPRYRLRALRRVGYSAGIIGAALGYTYLEYAERHQKRL